MPSAAYGVLALNNLLQSLTVGGDVETKYISVLMHHTLSSRTLNYGFDTNSQTIYQQYVYIYISLFAG